MVLKYIEIKNIDRIKRAIDRIAYASLVLDICIAIITTLSIMKIGDPQAILIPVNYMLTAVVALSLLLFISLFLLKYERKILDSLSVRYRFHNIFSFRYTHGKKSSK